MGKREIRVYIDPYGNTLNMWWDEPKNSFISEETKRSYDVIVKDKGGRPIGLEKIGFFPEEIDPIRYLKGKYKFLLEAHKKLSSIEKK